MPWDRTSTRPASDAPRASRDLARKLGAKVLTMGAMAFVALLTVGMSIPASAFGDATATAGGTRAASAEGSAQHLSVTDALEPASSRDAYTATTAAQFAAAKAAAAAKQASHAPIGLSFNPSGTGPVRWPFAVSVKLGPGFGAPATCRGCMAVHQGQDFLAPTGSTLYSIADGVVVEHSESGSFGNHVVIRHTIDGQTVESLYAHMISGSSPLQVGQTVQVGQAIGLLGSTGATTAPHLHLQISVNGSNVDPFAYLKAHAG